MKFTQIIFVVAAVLHVPITLFPGRAQVYTFYGIGKKGISHVITTIIMVSLSALVPCIYPDIIGLLGLLGGLTIGGSGYMMPLLLKVISMKDTPIYNPKKLFFLFSFLVIGALCVTSVVLSVMMGKTGE